MNVKKRFALWRWTCKAGHGWLSSSGVAKPCPLCGEIKVEREGPA